MHETFGSLVKRAREARGLSQQQLAEMAKTTQSTIDRIESGETLYSRAAPRVAHALGIPFVLKEGRDGPAIEVPVEVSDVEFERRFSRVTRAPEETPVYGAVEGGEGFIILDKNPIDHVPRPEPLHGVTDGYLVYIAGDSMWPAYRSGERAIVHPRLPPVPDETCIFYTNNAMDDGATIKHLVKITQDAWIVEQYNPHKQFALSRKEWPICHRVVGKYTRR